ncbi:iron ABC transporter permease [Brevibacillus humidisoli]|uniref:FecCD family ABC transporter permease n=1 Tax=Brevibacillus humidisoli TaxID=2895522 RepID=UPI001E2DBD12|nr:iron ABC transporter permease [Brevibacillus humidisoli]UFJ39442.1 iron ABC transporter permease [Brevibacillus humidisoli]
MEVIRSTQVERRRAARAAIVMSALGILILVMLVISLNTGYIRLAPFDVWKTLIGAGTDKQELILFDFRLPRIVISVLVGAGLAVSGCILQGLARNALAEPGILGINSGAGLMVILFVSFYPTNAAAPVFLLPLLALVGAGLTAALIYGLAFKKHEGLSPTRLVLTGIAVAAGINAAMIVLTIRLDPNRFQFVATWLAGNIWGTDWDFVLALLPWLVVLLPFVFRKANVLNVLNLGELTAAGLGVLMEKERRYLLAAAVGLVASCIAVSGGITFVGLIAPHLARQLVGPKHQFLLPASALTGGLLLITADTLGRWILQPSEIPTGIVVAVVGAPYFLYLLAKSKA